MTSSQDRKRVLEQFEGRYGFSVWWEESNLAPLEREFLEGTFQLAFSDVLERRGTRVTIPRTMTSNQRGAKARVVRKLSGAMLDAEFGSKLVADAAGLVKEGAKPVRFKREDFEEMFPDSRVESLVETCLKVYGEDFEDRLLAMLKKRYEGRHEELVVQRRL